MYKVLVADDEKNIRDGLMCILDWPELGFEIAYEASNGMEAMEIILSQNPDLVLMDIRMPKMYGTELIEKVREEGYTGEFIVLSGYADFSYAQTAIRYGAHCYLTKPIDEDELLQAVNKVLEKLKQSELNAKKIKRYSLKAKDVILHELVTGTYSLDSADSKLPHELNDMGLLSDCYQVIIYEKYGLSQEDDKYDLAELLKASGHEKDILEYFTEEENEVILLKGAVAIDRFEHFLKKYVSEDPMKGSPMDSLFISYGRPVKSYDEIYLSFEEAYSLSKRRFFCTQGQHTLGYDELPDVGKTMSVRPDREMLTKYSERVIACIFSFNRNLLAETLFVMESLLYNCDETAFHVKLFMADFIISTFEGIKANMTGEDINLMGNAQIIEQVQKFNFLFEIIQYFTEELSKIMDSMGHPGRDAIIEDILYYIDHNYQNSLKLETIAPLFGYNSAYLGKVFSKSVGETFNSYVDRKRIDKAKELLSGELKVYEIAKIVGYAHVDYFHMKFKKYTGVSPAEYRKTISE